MAKCEVTIGIIHEHKCGQPAIDKCSKCGKNICDTHKHFIELEVYCTECAAELATPYVGRVTKLKNPPYIVKYQMNRNKLFYKFGFRPFTFLNYQDFENMRSNISAFGSAGDDSFDS